VEGNLVRLLKEKSIDLQTEPTNVQKNYKGKEVEFDILAMNGTDVVAVEVKTSLKEESHIDFFLRNLCFQHRSSKNFTHIYPELSKILSSFFRDPQNAKGS